MSCLCRNRWTPAERHLPSPGNRTALGAPKRGVANWWPCPRHVSPLGQSSWIPGEVESWCCDDMQVTTLALDADILPTFGHPNCTRWCLLIRTSTKGVKSYTLRTLVDVGKHLVQREQGIRDGLVSLTELRGVTEVQKMHQLSLITTCSNGVGPQLSSNTGDSGFGRFGLERLFWHSPKEAGTGFSLVRVDSCRTFWCLSDFASCDLYLSNQRSDV